MERKRLVDMKPDAAELFREQPGARMTSALYIV